MTTNTCAAYLLLVTVVDAFARNTNSQEGGAILRHAVQYLCHTAEGTRLLYQSLFPKIPEPCLKNDRSR